MNEYHLITNDKKGKKDVKSEINDLNQIIINYQKKNQEAAMMAQKLDHIISGHNLPKYWKIHYYSFMKINILFTQNEMCVW